MDCVTSRPHRKPIPREIKARIWFFCGGRCWYCGTHLNPFDNLAFDHITPVALGGWDEIENLVCCCKWCNASKWSLPLEEWRKNFLRSDLNGPAGEDPWRDESRLFWFEREDNVVLGVRADEIMYYRRENPRVRVVS